MPQWKVVGGVDKGGIVVREEQAFGSPAAKDRLATGSVVEELELVGERLRYRLLTGSGPLQGWVSLKVSGKDLLVPQRTPAPAERSPAAPTTPAPTPPAPARKQTPEAIVKPKVTADDTAKRQMETEAKTKVRNGDFARYCLKYKILGYPLPSCKLRVICFHAEGGTEASFTSPGTPFLEWAKQDKTVEICALDFPGRNRLLKVMRHSSIDTLAPEFMAVLHEKLKDGVPYVVWAHSVGTWVAFEVLMLARRLGLPSPRAALFMAFPAPHLPVHERPWRRSAELNGKELWEELERWDRDHYEGPSKAIFEQHWESTWEPLLRDDLRLFDEYEFKHSGAPLFDFPIHAWHFDGEDYGTAEMVAKWKAWTSAEFDHRTMYGMGHLTCLYKPELKVRYFEKVTELLKDYAAM